MDKLLWDISGGRPRFAIKNVLHGNENYSTFLSGTAGYAIVPCWVSITMAALDAAGVPPDETIIFVLRSATNEKYILQKCTLNQDSLHAFIKFPAGSMLRMLANGENIQLGIWGNDTYDSYVRMGYYLI